MYDSYVVSRFTFLVEEDHCWDNLGENSENFPLWDSFIDVISKGSALAEFQDKVDITFFGLDGSIELHDVFVFVFGDGLQNRLLSLEVLVFLYFFEGDHPL